MKRIRLPRLTISKKINFTVLLITTTITVSIGVFSYLSYRNNAIHLKGQEALSVATTVASIINGDKFENYDKTGAVDDYYTELYNELCTIKKRTDVAYVYTMVDDGKNYKYIVEGHLQGQTLDITKLGDTDEKSLYGDEPQQVLKTGNGEMTDIKYDSEYGHLVSAYAAIKNSSGNVVGITGVDLKAEAILNEINMFIPKLIVILLISEIVLFILLYFLIRGVIIKPLQQITADAREIAVGNINIRLDEKYLKKRDETGELFCAFRSMMQNLALLVKEIGDVSRQHKNGNFDEMVQEDAFTGAFRDVAAQLNQMASGYVHYIKRIMSCIESFGNGNFDAEFEKFPGKLVLINDNMEELRRNLKNITLEINALVGSTIEGKLATRADADRFQGDWGKTVQLLNRLLDVITEPVNEISAVMELIAEGNLKAEVTGSYKGDFSLLKDSVNNTAAFLRMNIEQISHILTEISKGNLNLERVNDYKGDFVTISLALNTIADSLNRAFEGIEEAAGQVNAGSEEVSQGSRALSQGVTEQASAIEQLNTSITEISAQTKKNAEYADNANQFAKKAMSDAESGNLQMKQMQEAMAEINEASANISKIIKSINDIAFQTNMLALNAAVEAARAGQYGKGFAVVAEEVRSLAARSADAAKQTAVLIEGTISKVAAGTGKANEAASALDKIVKEVEKAAKLVAQIASISNEQATTIAQVNKGIGQVDVVVQSNSSSSEESAAASAELSAQAELLTETIGNFKLRKRESGQANVNHLTNTSQGLTVNK